MLLQRCPNHLSLLPRTLASDQSSPFLFFPFPQPYPKTLSFRNPKPSKFLIRSSTDHTHTTLPKSAIQRIADKLRSLGYVDEDPNQIVDPKIEAESEPVNRGSAGEIFVPLRQQLPKYRVGHTIDSSWSSPENPVPAPGSGGLISRFHELSSEVKKESAKKHGEERKPSLAKLRLPKEELRRLQGVGIGIKKKLKVGKAGITEGIVNGIHERWRSSELVKIVCEDLCKMNMKRTHEVLERKTGGLVIWRSGSKIILYRGPNYKYPYFLHHEDSTNGNTSGCAPVSCIEDGAQNDVESAGSTPINKMARASLIPGVGPLNRVRFQLPGEEQLTEEADRTLDGLGPRFTDWWGCEPQPVDGDLLPGVVSGYRRPFRLLPYGVKPKLTNDEMTILRRLGRPLPCHFALGRNRKHQGLAASIIKLWEKCEIAKIAIKRGVQNTNSELMAEELRRLTGGTLLSRDKEFIVLYRGKDFLPSVVSSAIEERRKYGIDREKQREGCGTSVISKLGTMERVSGGKPDELNGQERVHVSEKKKMQTTAAAIKRTSIMLSRALENRAKAEQLLSELEDRQSPQQIDVDKEGITEEERYMLRRVGLRMNAFLLLGRRGVFDGTIENMHLHWKYRELVKILCNQKSNKDALAVARTLEAESGGILVAVEKVSKGHAIIVYRGKNYRRPSSLRPQTLLNKREAMKRSLEAQRCQSLKLHVLKITRRIDDLKRQLDKSEEMNGTPSAEKSRLHLVKEEIMQNMLPPEYKRLDSESIPGFPSASLLHACHEENVEAMEGCDSMYTIDGAQASGGSLNITQQEKDLVENEDKIEEPDETELQSSSFSELEENCSDIFTKNVEDGDVEDASSSENSESQGWANWSASQDAEHDVLGNGRTKPSMESDNELKPVGCGDAGSRSNRTTIKPMPLSNRDRLLLRKQALKMKKRPVLAVGSSNIVSGVAKTIITHFKKHPLAIVNVKARAKGTPIQELVFKLEQETGAVLVSQETNKVILYRGWGAGSVDKEENKGGANKQSVCKGIEDRPTVSPELMAAIRSECGFQH